MKVPTLTLTLTLNGRSSTHLTERCLEFPESILVFDIELISRIRHVFSGIQGQHFPQLTGFRLAGSLIWRGRDSLVRSSIVTVDGTRGLSFDGWGYSTLAFWAISRQTVSGSSWVIGNRKLRRSVVLRWSLPDCTILTARTSSYAWKRASADVRSWSVGATFTSSSSLVM